MSEPTRDDVITIVSSLFEVSEISPTTDTLQFKIEDKQYKSKFVDLARKLEAMNILCRLDKSADGIYILANRYPPQKTRKWLSKTWTPRILFSVVVVLVMIDGYYRTINTNSLIDIGDPLENAILYTISLLGILGIHESGHLFAAKIHKIRTTWPYFIPGIPIYGIPTFGAFIQARGLTINRDILFDVAIAGPIAGLVIAIIVSFYGAYTAPILDVELAEDLFANSQLIEMNENILMTLALMTFGKGGEGTEVIMTPVLFAAWLGFLITFLNLLPAWQLDGGHIARTLFGAKWHKIATYASMGVLVLLGYFIMAIFILLLSSRSPAAQPLDDISPLSKNRKLLYIAVVILAVLCAPLPSTILP